jgi:hypothetical protein
MSIQISDQQRVVLPQCVDDFFAGASLGFDVVHFTAGQADPLEKFDPAVRAVGGW